MELSDAVVSPSAYLQNWMIGSGFNLPKNTEVIPLYLSSPDNIQNSPTACTVHNPRHFIFYGRLEERKGINVFLAALAGNELKEKEFDVTFLGKPSSMSLNEIKDFLEKNRPDIAYSAKFYDNLSSQEAQDYLSRADGVAVIPSLLDNSPCVIYEVLRLGVPFIASDTGGIPELLRPEDHERYLFSPNPRALAAKLKQVLTAETWSATKPAYDSQAVSREWLRWLAENEPSRKIGNKTSGQVGSTAATKPSLKDTTIILTHYERPHLLEQCLRALSVQTDRSFDVVLVDDGSASDEAQTYLDRVERGFGDLEIKVVRTDNRYVGAARNEGLRHAENRYVIFMDDDNLAFPDMVEVFRRAAQLSRADIVTSQMQFFHDPESEPDPQLLISGERWSFPGGPTILGIFQNCFGDATAIYKREIFSQLGEFHEHYGITYEDWQMHLRACLYGKTLLSLPVPLFWYRVEPGSIIRTTSKHLNCQVIASVFREQVNTPVAPLIDFVMGLKGRFDIS